VFAALACAAAVAVTAGDSGVLALAPALLVALAVSRRRYPGAQLLLAMRARSARSARPRGLAPIRSAGRALLTAPRGGLLLARSLADRPPPGLLPAR
jgi:hypothetical protein